MGDTERDPVVIDELVTLDPEGTEAKFARAEFATVVFHNIAETYPEDAHIECNYTVTSDMIPSTRDYVALYKVGWMSPRDYLYYEWAPIPKNYKQGSDADASVLFPAHKLPKDDGEFYQFCYVSSSGQIKGASTPFQFRRAGADDFVEIEDEETNMLVIRSKTIYLEENLQQAQSQRQKLLETQEALQKERDSVITKYQEVKNRLVTVETENSKMKGQLGSSEETVKQLKRESRDLITVRDELQARIDKLKKEHVTLNESIATLTSDLAAANEKITSLREELNAKKADVKKLQTEKDELSGRNAVLAEEAELIKKHYEASEQNMDQFSKHSESLQIKLAQQESLIDHLRRNVDTLSTELEDNRLNLDKQTAISVQDKERLQELEERVKNAEDKLMAAEASKAMLQEEIVTFEVTQAEMSMQIEKSKAECASLKEKLCRLEEDFTQKSKIQAKEMEQNMSDLVAAVSEKESLQKENSNLKHQLTLTFERTVEGHGSMSIMKQSLTQIKERLEKKEKQCRSLEKAMKSREQDFLEREREMRRETEDLREKILMCGEEYKALYIEKNKVEKKMERLGSKKRSKAERRSESEPAVERELTQMSSQLSLTESDVTVSQQIDTQVEELEKALDSKILKKDKYKKMHKEEQEKNEQMLKKFNEELQEKEAEIARLKKRIRDIPNDWDLKVRALEKCVTEKEMIIDDLNKKLRECSHGNKDEINMSPRRVVPVQMENKCVWNVPTQSPGVPLVYPGPCGQFWPGPSGYPYPGQMQYPYPGGAAGSPMPAYPGGQVGSPVMPYPGGSASSPLSGPLPPLVYPHPPAKSQVPPVPPRTKFLGKDQIKRDQTDGEFLDECYEDTDDIDGVLKPLPAPLEPQKLPSAKVAVVKRAISQDVYECEDSNKQLEELLVVDVPQELKVNIPQPEKSASCHVIDFCGPENDRFYDAEGSAMKLCSDCNKTFPADVDEQVFVEHQMSHLGTLCPVCKMLKPENMTDNDFEIHVNKHYEEEDRAGIY